MIQEITGEIANTDLVFFRQGCSELGRFGLTDLVGFRRKNRILLLHFRVVGKAQEGKRIDDRQTFRTALDLPPRFIKVCPIAFLPFQMHHPGKDNLIRRVEFQRILKIVDSLFFLANPHQVASDVGQAFRILRFKPQRFDVTKKSFITFLHQLENFAEGGVDLAVFGVKLQCAFQQIDRIVKAAVNGLSPGILHQMRGLFLWAAPI
ncbi:hypothetical protein N6L27_00840 [Leisingera sp. SS27]|uniref:hypothetical protein n=1 Tax=Leisingera sp. SS27 TaxID=2979462 RepID=UPI00232F4525|nr:hypothetical protein [Leisingera sp. SS27]MDC0656540.1 hypothetical protein [Leisingera sp. SS27]